MDWEGVVLIQVKAWECGLGGCVCVCGGGWDLEKLTPYKIQGISRRLALEDSAPNSNALFLVSISEHPSGVRG